MFLVSINIYIYIFFPTHDEVLVLIIHYTYADYYVLRYVEKVKEKYISSFRRTEY